MKKFTSLLLFFSLFLVLASTQVAAVGMFINWPDGSTDLIEVDQGKDVTFNYNSLEGQNHDVLTEVFLVKNADYQNPVDTLVETTDRKGTSGYKTFATDNLDPALYTLYGKATNLANGAVSAAFIDFNLNEADDINNPPTLNGQDYFEYDLSEVDANVLTMSDYGNDIDGDELSYTLDVSQTDNDVIMCTIYFESTIHCDFIGAGLTTFDIVVSDGEATAKMTITVKINNDGPINTAPRWVGLDTYYEIGVGTGTTNVVNLEDFAIDDENDPLTFSVENDNMNIIDCQITGDSILRCTANNIGTTEVTVRVSDGQLSDTESITFNVFDDSDPNEAPFFVNLPDFFQYDIDRGTVDVMNLANYAQDPNGDELTYTVIDETGIVNCRIVQDSVLQCDLNTIGQGSIDVVVTDGSLSDVESVTIKVTEIIDQNTAPYWDGLPFTYTYNLDEDTVRLAKLSNYAFDDDGDSLSFLIQGSGPDSNIAICAIDGQTNLNCALREAGSTSFDVLVSDGELSDVQTLTLVIEQDNRAPVFDVDTPDFFRFDIDEQVAELFKVEDYVTDADGDALNYQLDQSNTDLDIIDCALDQYTNIFCDLNGLGTTTFDVVVSDSENTVSKTVTVQVFDDNTPPYFDGLTLFYQYNIDQSNVNVVDLGDVAKDVDGDFLTYSIDTSNTDDSVISCSLTNVDTINCNLNGVGSTTLVATVSDGKSQTDAVITIQVVQDANNAPYFSGLPSSYRKNINEETSKLVRLSQYAFDIDGDVLSYSLDQSNTDTTIVDCFLDQYSNVWCDLEGVGTTTITAVVSDGELQDTQVLTIEVFEDVNIPPYFKTNMPTYFQYNINEGNAELFRVSNFVVDPDGDESDLDYSIDQTNTDFNVIACTIDTQTDIECDLNGIGLTTFDVVVSDGVNTISKTITVRVYEDANNAPYFENLQSYYEYNIDIVWVDVVDLADYANDPDGDDLTFQLDQSNTDTSIIDCQIVQDSILNCDLEGVGLTTIDVIVSDGDLSARRTITIRVYEDTNLPPVFDANTPTYFEFDIDEELVELFRVENYVYDPEGQALDFQLDQSNTDLDIIDCALDQYTNIFCNLNGLGTTTFDVVVSDGENTVRKTVTVRVYDDNTPPYFDNGMSLFYVFNIDESNVNVVDLDDFGRDADGDVLSYALDQSNTDSSVLDCSLNGGTVVNCDLNSVGETTLEAIVNDGKVQTTATITIRVIEDANNPPEFDVNTPMYFEYDIALGEVTVMRVSDYVTDADGDALNYNLDESDTDRSIVNCDLDEFSRLDCDLNGLGTTTVDIIVDDGQDSVKKTITIRVYEVDQNTAPYWIIPMNYEFGLSEDYVEFNLPTYAFDDENDPLTFSFDNTQTDQNVLSCTLDYGQLLHCDFNGLGTTSVDIIVSDGEFQARKTLFITVLDDAANAVIIGSNEAKVLETALFDGRSSTGSLGSDIVRYEWTILEGASTYSAVGSVISHQFQTVGTHTVTLLVTDANGKQDSDLLQVSVEQAGPVAVITADTRAAVGTVYPYNGLQSYTFGGASIVSYEWSIVDGQGNLVTQQTGSTQSIIFTEQDEYTIRLTVTDSNGVTDTASLVMQARNPTQDVDNDFGAEDGLKVNSIEIDGFDFERAYIDGDLTIVANVENVGNEDFDDVRMTFTLPEYGFRVKSHAIDLDKGDQQTIVIYTFVPDYVEEGVYYPVVSFTADDARRSKPMYLEVFE